jgi:hypothetical protein
MIPDGTFELYRLDTDPEEKRDVWGEDPGAGELSEKLAQMIDAAQAPGAAQAAVLSAKPSPSRPSRGELGGALRFLGADLPDQTSPGATIDVTWYFESLKALEGHWKVFVHVEGPGRFLGDHDPGIERWQPGHIIADRQKLRVDGPPGDYTVYLGLFQGNQRLPLTNAGPQRRRK